MRIDGLVLDMDGVLTTSGGPVPGAAAAVARLRAAGLPMRIVTSTTSQTCAEMVALLRKDGFDFTEDEVLTASALAASYLRERHADERVFLIGDARPEDLAGIRLVDLDESPEVVLISGADRSFTYDALNGIFRALLDGAAFVAMHRASSWVAPAGPSLEAGAYLAALELACGRQATVTGKPAPTCFEAGLRALGVAADRAAMVGDDINNDVLAAQACGLTGVLVRTGKFREEHLTNAAAAPDHVIGSIADLPELLGL